MLLRALVSAVALLLALQNEAAEPIVTNTLPAPGATLPSLSTVEVFFSEDVTGVDAADLLINGTPATDVQSFGTNQYVFSFPEFSSGTVTVSWSPTHGIQDISDQANAFVPGAAWTYTLRGPPTTRDLLVSEFLADNDKTLNDEDGDSSDWVELFNPTDQPLELTGCFLTNDTNNLARWRLPELTLEPNSYLVVFASEKNRTNTGTKLHTNFKLPVGGGFLALVDPATNIISSFTYPAQRKDVSYGRERSNPALIGFFPKPSPGTPNLSVGPGFAPKVQFSNKSGTFTTPFELVLTAENPNAVIYYSTVNGKNLPTEGSNIYTAPILVTNTTHLRARAFVPGLLPSDPHSESFIRLTGAVVRATSDLPIVILHNYGAGAVPATGEQFVTMQIFEPKNGVASMTNRADFSERARFRRRGSSTQDYPKWSFALEAWNEFNDDKNVSVLGMPEESDWNFYAPNNFEPVLIHNPFMYELSRSIGRYASRTRFVEVYLNTAGGAVASNNYFGIYVIEEKIKRGPSRVDVDKLEPEHLKEPQVTGGYMLKIDRPDPGESNFSAAGESGWSYVDPKGPVIRSAARAPQRQYILNYLAKLGTALSSTNLTDPVLGYAQYVDVPASIDHQLLNVLAFNVDGLRLSTYLHKPRNGKLAWGPIWDFDRALGSTDGRDANPKSWGDTGGSSFFQWPIWSRMFADPNFWQKWIDRWEELRRDQLSTTNVNSLIDQLANEVRKAQPREQARWRVAPRGGSYQAEVTSMKTYLKNRSEYIDAQLVRPPRLSLPSGPVTNATTISLTATNTIYYTLDGSDPRLPGGQISPTALTYSGPIPITGNTRVFARSHKPGHTGGPTTTARSPWSGFVAATYVLETPQLAITELMYNPEAAPIGSTNSAADYEFIEVKNVGTNPLNLAGFRFTNGVDFAFTNGTLQSNERTVIVKNRAAFQDRYGTSILVAGEFTGSLDNSGERVTLLGPLQEPIGDFRFENSWYPVTDGLGFSLVLRDENAPFSSYGSVGAWRQSRLVGGSPGAPDLAPAPFSKVYVNELLANPINSQLDKIELFNAGSQPADITGWYLSDDFSEPKKFRLPSGSIVPAGGFLTLDETQFNANGKGFAFSSNGDEVYLFSADGAGNLTGYTHGFKFGAAAPGVSFGRYLSLDQREHFVAQTDATFGGTNSAPIIGPIVISEIMFEPSRIVITDNTLDEFIELRNISSQAVALYHPAHPTNSWKLRGGADFDFPPGASIPAGGLVLVVNFDPYADSTIAANFWSRFNLPADAVLFGPYNGKLSNSGERLSLLRPAVPPVDSTSSIPYILVDEVNYSATSSWPNGANGTGKSLQRYGRKFGDDPFSWTVADPTAGRDLNLADPDPDGDGLPSEWEVAHDLNQNDSTGENGSSGDPDGDGSSNLQEFLAGTDPQSASSMLRLSGGVIDGQNSLSFTAAAGKSYSILYTTDLGTGAWYKLTDVPAGMTQLEWTLPDTTNGPTRFYRVVTPQQE